MKLHNILKYIDEDLWNFKIDEIPGIKRFYVSSLRIVSLSLKGFNEDKCYLRASALTYYTLLSVVPVFAMFFGIARGFGLEKILEDRLLSEFSNQHEAVIYIIDFASSLIENTKSGAIAGVGVLTLLYAVIKLLGNVEESFNDIWKIEAQRSITRKISDYVLISIIAPLLIILSGSITVFLKTKVLGFLEHHGDTVYLEMVFFLVLRILSYVIPCLLFTFIYIFVPNTKVKIRAALAAGIATGIIYQLLQWGYIKAQVALTSYNAIYGSFAALPLFLIWLQLSWLIVLLGVEISCACQTASFYEYEPYSKKLSQRIRKILSVRILSMIDKHFKEGKIVSDVEISKNIHIPIMLVRSIGHQLCDTGLLVEHFQDGSEDTFFIPGTEVGTLTIQSVFKKIDSKGINKLPSYADAEMDKILENVKLLEQYGESCDANRTIERL